MTRVTDFGKAFLIASATRRSHPDEATLGVYRMDQVSSVDNYWMLLLRTIYFTTGGNPNSGHRTLAQFEETPTSVVGYASHTTGAAAWYTGNSLPVGSAVWTTPTIGTGEAYVVLPNRTLLFMPAATYPISNIEGVALCLRNAAAAATECVQIYRFTGGPVTATSSGQTLSLSNGRATLSDT